MKVRSLMTAEVITLSATDPLVAAEEIMGLRRLRHLPVVENGKCVGLVTHRDLLRAYVSSVQVAEGQRIAAHILKARVNVKEIMHTRIRTVGPDDSLVDAVRLLHDYKFGCLPVVDGDGVLLGIITDADFLRLAEVLLEHLDEHDPELVDRLGASL